MCKIFAGLETGSSMHCGHAERRSKAPKASAHLFDGRKWNLRYSIEKIDFS
jgi:hypothetical protein